VSHDQATRAVFRKGARVTLRPIEETDAELLYLWINDPEISRWVSAYLPMSMLQEQEWARSAGARSPDDIVLGITIEEGRLSLLAVSGV